MTAKQEISGKDGTGARGPAAGPWRDRLWLYAPLSAICLVLLWHSLQFDFVTDDAYISFVYSRNLAEHGQLVFNLGDPVEGFTNFLWTFVLGLFMLVKLPPEIMSRVLGTGFAAGTLVLVFKQVSVVLGRRTPWAYLAPLLLALSSGYACWSSGGLETQMFTFFVSAALLDYSVGSIGRAGPSGVLDHRALRRVGVYLALAAMTRPEGLLVAGVLGVHRLAMNLGRDRRLTPTIDELMCVVRFLLLWAPYFVWRWRYFGNLFPNTYYVKAAGEVSYGGDFSADMLANGLYYIKRWAEQTWVLWAAPLIVVGLVFARPRSPRFVYGSAALSLALVYLAYAAKVGGDFMGLHRFIMPVFVIAAIGLTVALAAASDWVAKRWQRPSRIGGAAVACALVAGFALGQHRLTVESLRWGNWRNDRGIDTPAFLWVYTDDRAAVGKHMRDCFTDDDFAVFGGVGAQPYYSKVRGIDAFGLVSWDVAHCQPRRTARAGHTKWAEDGLLKKQPRRDGHSCPPPRASGRGYDWSKVQGGPPTFWFARYALHRDPKKIGRGDWRGVPPGGRDYRQVTLHIGCTDDVHTTHSPGWKPRTPEPRQSGVYYTFFIHKDRLPSFHCKGLVP